MNRFENQCAIVTGAGRGIGAAIAKRLVSEGATVAVVSRTEANSAKVAAELNTLREGSAHPYAVDVADSQAVSALAARIVEECGGRIDVLVNNAGITRDGLIMRMSEADWDAVVDTNLKGVFNFTQPIVRLMLKQRSGRIVNISSTSGVAGNAGQTNYAASKAGVIGFTKALAREVASRGITANVIAPGFVTTDMTDVLGDNVKETVLKAIPLGVFGEPDDIASAVAFLASAEAKFITGQTLVVDGGMVM
ncbi:MAG: 3-oxoacyl-[acyl-carrier-protein] reductase [Verrucomicrobiia bacterium]